MVSLTALWFPIVLSAVLVFVVSSVMHMVLKYHAGDFAGLPDEEKALEGMRGATITPGDYTFPYSSSMKEMGSPEMKAKFERGPVGMMTVLPNGPIAMGASLVQWFVYCLAVGVLVAYITGLTVAPGAEYMHTFRVASVAAFLAYAGAQPMASIWMKRRWSTTWKHVLDGFIYSLVTAGAFAGFYPG